MSMLPTGRSFIVQIGGGLLSLSKTINTANLGLHVLTGGMTFQQLLIVCFMVLTIQFSRHLRLNTADTSSTHDVSRMTHVRRASLILITVRNPLSPHLPAHLPHFRTPRAPTIYIPNTNTISPLVPHSLPHHRIHLRPRGPSKHLHQPPRILRLRLRRPTHVLFARADEILASG